MDGVRRLRLGWLSCALGLVAFAELALRTALPGWEGVELALARPILAWRSPPATLLAVALSLLADGRTVAVVTTWVFLRAPRWPDRVYLLCSVLSAAALERLLKPWFLRARPGGEFAPLVHEKLYSMPSGHSLAAVCLYGFLAYLLARRYPHRRLPILAGAAGIIAGVGWSRVYLGVHYPTDVLAAWVVAWPFLFAAIRGHARATP